RHAQTMSRTFSPRRTATARLPLKHSATTPASTNASTYANADGKNWAPSSTSVPSTMKYWMAEGFHSIFSKHARINGSRKKKQNEGHRGKTVPAAESRKK